MDWFRRNPKKAAGLSALAVLCLVVLVWGVAGGSGRNAEPSTLGAPSPLATPTKSPTRALDGLATPSGSPTPIGQMTGGFPSSGMGAAGFAGTGFDRGLKPHHIVITAESDGPLAGVGWKMPTADGPRGGKDAVGQRSFRHEATVYGKPDYAQLYTFDGPDSSWVSCTITVDGKVTDHQVAKGPWGQVFCQG
ncbi:MAG TPA: hypothetical protein VHO29_14180 [Marmoricola sp.]|nr:hypothetical protein [Marmoricola sp.]